MRHLKVGRKLSRRKEHRTAMLANLASSLVKNGNVRTTDAKAKEIRPFVEKMVTFAKRGDLHARRIVLSRLKDPLAVKRLFEEYGPRFAARLGGYTRILKLGFRHGDNAPVSLIEFVGEEKLKLSPKKSKTAVKKKKEDLGEAVGDVVNKADK
jgi:large subunit ribosomal protein L17